MRWAGFSALHFNRSTNVEPTYKLSNEAQNPTYCKCAVRRCPFHEFKILNNTK